MNVEDVELSVDGDCVPGRLNVPDDPTGAGVICLPGAEHGPYGDVFDRVARAASERGLYFLRYESWADMGDIQQKTLGRLHREIDAAFDLLASRDCTETSLVGKSAGGGIVLTYAPGRANRLVVWAPAIRLAAESNVDAILEQRLADTDGAQVGPDRLETIDVPVCILQGEDDEGFLENSRELVDDLPNAELVEIEGLDHSFTGSPFDRIVVDETIARLTA
ncbi:alpha/beta hydrolase [Halorussus halobius]|uniref:alpha/beta hydrolase n=1 Tax=Halorussus halobius TaxID=1710537 RepID=UPI0010918D08|nr:alpha/beta hydrolase [Halorussus halobius]